MNKKIYSTCPLMPKAPFKVWDKKYKVYWNYHHPNNAIGIKIDGKWQWERYYDYQPICFWNPKDPFFIDSGSWGEYLSIEEILLNKKNRFVIEKYKKDLNGA